MSNSEYDDRTKWNDLRLITTLVDTYDKLPVCGGGADWQEYYKIKTAVLKRMGQAEAGWWVELTDDEELLKSGDVAMSGDKPVFIYDGNYAWKNNTVGKIKSGGINRVLRPVRAEAQEPDAIDEVNAAFEATHGQRWEPQDMFDKYDILMANHLEAEAKSIRDELLAMITERIMPDPSAHTHTFPKTFTSGTAPAPGVSVDSGHPQVPEPSVGQKISAQINMTMGEILEKSEIAEKKLEIAMGRVKRVAQVIDLADHDHRKEKVCLKCEWEDTIAALDAPKEDM